MLRTEVNTERHGTEVIIHVLSSSVAQVTRLRKITN